MPLSMTVSSCCLTTKITGETFDIFVFAVIAMFFFQFVFKIQVSQFSSLVFLYTLMVNFSNSLVLKVILASRIMFNF